MQRNRSKPHLLPTPSDGGLATPGVGVGTHRRFFMSLLLVEDDEMLGASMVIGLELSGFVVRWAKSLEEASRVLQQQMPSLMLLDVMLGDGDGIAWLKQLRAEGHALPVFLVTARHEVNQRIEGLNAGADDYLVKPFDLGELVARVRALTRRQGGRVSELLVLGDLVVEPAQRTCTLRGQPVDLSARIFDVLVALMERPGALLSMQQIEQRVYGVSVKVASNAVEVHLHRLRQKLGEGWIRNVRGIGYMIDRPQPIDAQP